MCRCGPRRSVSRWAMGWDVFGQGLHVGCVTRGDAKLGIISSHMASRQVPAKKGSGGSVSWSEMDQG